MIKHLLFIIGLLFSSSIVYAQCNAEDFDWEEAGFGVSPDPENGETFADGELNVPYEQIIYLLVPENASDIDDNLPDLPIDSASLVNIVITQDGNEFTPEEFGLSLTCNNSGVSPDPCTFLGGQAGCGVLSGTPLLPGEFNVTIEALVYVTFIGAVIPNEFNYDAYTINIAQIGSTLEDEKAVSEVRVSPNPFAHKALLQFEALNGGAGELTIVNLLGEVKYQEVISVQKGFNKIQISSNDIDSGIYLYHLNIGDYNVTKRLVVNK